MYQEKKFNLPAIEGLSQEQMDIHLGLYVGYVKNTNKVLEELHQLKDGGDPYIMAELRRRLGFEFDGMRMHEYYFEQLEGGTKSVSEESTLLDKIQGQFGSFEEYLIDLRRVAGTRGIGWVVTYYDDRTDQLLNAWVGDHELGQLATSIIFAMDMWEHAYMVDYRPSTKSDYVDIYLSNVNWDVVNGRLSV